MGVPDAAAQSAQVGAAMQHRPMSVGDKFFLVEGRWWRDWKAFTGYAEAGETPRRVDGAPAPGPLDNLPLLEGSKESGSLRTDIGEGSGDYTLVNSEAWALLSTWYKPAGPVIQRSVIGEGAAKRPVVELYPIQVTVARPVPQADAPKKLEFSRTAKLKDVVWVAAGKFALPPFQCSISLISERGERLQVSKQTQTLEELGVVTGAWLLLESSDDPVLQQDLRSLGIGPASSARGGSSRRSASDGRKKVSATDRFRKRSGSRTGKRQRSASRGSARKSGSKETDEVNGEASTSKTESVGLFSRLGWGSWFGGGSARRGSDSDDDHASEKVPRGLTGLQNLGNTCFMNSALQCLSNTEVLCEYFLSDSYRADINTTNPLGMKGNLAGAYADLQQQLWSGRFSSTAPRKFKQTIGKYAPQFTGYQQHDSQELTAFLLDGLHEDLNKVKKKPYVELKDYDGKTEDKIVAAEAWKNHLARNQSFIVDHFQGQLKSTVVCPMCARVSITFDPFMYLSVPLPDPGEKSLELVMYYLDTSRTPERYSVRVPRNRAKTEDLRDALSVASGIPAHRLLLGDVWRDTLHFMYDHQTIFIRADCPVVAYELPEVPVKQALPAPDYIKAPIYFRYASDDKLPGDAFAAPRVFTFPPKATHAEVDAGVRKFIAPLFKDGAHADLELRSLSYVKPQGVALPTDSAEYDVGGRDLIRGLAVVVPKETVAKVCNLDVVSTVGQHASVKAARDAAEAAAKRQPSLNDCLSKFTSSEKLNENNPWYCGKCKEHRQATKTMQVYSMPEILIVHFKRFSYTSRLRDKLDTAVTFPLTGLDMAPWCLSHQAENPGQPLVYDLYAVSNHMGFMGGGHYTAYAKNRFDNKWYHFNDSRVSPAADNHIVSGAAYMLFYRRRKNQPRVAADAVPVPAVPPATPQAPVATPDNAGGDVAGGAAASSNPTSAPRQGTKRRSTAGSKGSHRSKASADQSSS